MLKLWKEIGFVVVIGMIMLLPQVGHAQQASIVGTVIDSGNAAVPGANVTATQVDTGRQFTEVTNENGGYRLVELPAGRYDLQAAAAGFGSTVLKGIELLVGQNATITLTMKVATVAQSVTVNTEAPLIDTQASQVAGNIDTKQMEDIPINGRNWQQLATLSKGITMNTITSRPGAVQDSGFLLNLDGQNVTQSASTSSSFGQTLIDPDAIAEYQVITNLFDVTMGQSTGVQIQAISKSGTNTLHGSAYGYFRDSDFNSPDNYTHTVLPYSDQQIGGTFGGPVIKDKLWYFVAFEYERTPNTTILVPAALPGQEFQLPTLTDLLKPIVKVDYQMSQKDHAFLRWGYSRSFNNNSVSTVPSAAVSQLYMSNFATLDWSHVSSPTMLHDFRLQYFYYHWQYVNAAFLPAIMGTTPYYTFPGLSLGPASNAKQLWYEAFLTPHYDLAWGKGKHEIKIGAELRTGRDYGTFPRNVNGTYLFSKLPANIDTLFPASTAENPSLWDFSSLDSIATQFTITYAKSPTFNALRPMLSTWIGDTWTGIPKVALNFGVRYDLAWKDLNPRNVIATSIPITTGYPPFGTQQVGFTLGIKDLLDIAPRVGVAWSPRHDLVIRGGSGLYFAGIGEQLTDDQETNSGNYLTETFLNNGQPGWILDPTGGVTAAEVFSGKYALSQQTPKIIASDFRMPYSWQSSIGVQKQFGQFMSFDSDLVSNNGHRLDSQVDPNLFYNPANGLYQNPITFGRPNSAYGNIQYDQSHGSSNYLALQNSFQRRYQRNFQLGVTYTLMFYKYDTGEGSSGYGATQVNPFNIMADWAKSTDFQRNTLRFNGIWNMPKGFQLSAYWAYGSPNPAYTTSTNVNPLGDGSTRIRSNLTIIPRDNFFGGNFQTLDMHLSKTFQLGEHIRVTGIAEVFNLYNHGQFTYNLLETAAQFGQRNGSAYAPREGQLGAKFAF
jgi:Carboxypeptidase regulatory-like domain